MKISIATDFSPVPAGRYLSDGPDSGERFRNEFLVPAINRGEDIHLVIDGTAGYGSSFLEEAFGGAIRRRLISKEEFKKRLRIEYSDPEFALYEELILHFVNVAEPSSDER